MKCARKRKFKAGDIPMKKNDSNILNTSNDLNDLNTSDINTSKGSNKSNAQNTGGSPHSSPLKKRRKLLWSLLFVVIAAATVWAVVSRSRSFSLGSFMTYIGTSSKPWLLAACASALGFIVFEGLAIASVCRAFGYHVNFGRSFSYSASDIYFSAITPSATGGQPACAYFMIKDKIPGTVVTVALLLNLVMYTLSILVISAIVLITNLQVFSSFGRLSRALIVIGFVIQSLLALFFIVLLLNAKLLRNICAGCIRFLCKIKILKNGDKKLRRLDEYITEYSECVKLINGRKKTLFSTFILNIFQRISVISVSALTFLACGGAYSGACRIWSVQCFSVIGSNSIPIPGAMGVADYIMLDGFANLMPRETAVNLELLSRSLSFYICVVICGAATLIKYAVQRKRRGASNI